MSGKRRKAARKATPKGTVRTVEDQFDEIAEETSEKAARVDCSALDYRDGLRGIIERLQVDLRAAQETSGDLD